MNQMRWLIRESAQRIFREHREGFETAGEDVWPADLWNTLEEADLTVVAVPVERGGAGGELGDAMSVLREAGRYAVPLPLAETFLAGWMLATSQQHVSSGFITLAPLGERDVLSLERNGVAWILNGRAQGIPWASAAKEIVVIADGRNGSQLARIEPNRCHITPGTNLAGEPRDYVVFDHLELSEQEVFAAREDFNVESVRWLGALTRAVLMAGAMETMLALTVQHAQERIQFGRPIAKFQAVQQQIAALAGEVAAAGRAADVAVQAAERGRAEIEIAVAKARVGEAVTICNEIAHQVHGAIGFTREHVLHRYSRRLWSWRDEFGPEVKWQADLGRRIAQRGAEHLWDFITGAFSEPN